MHGIGTATSEFFKTFKKELDVYSLTKKIDVRIFLTHEGNYRLIFLDKDEIILIYNASEDQYIKLKKLPYLDAVRKIRDYFKKRIGICD